MRLADYPVEPRYPATLLRSERLTDAGSPEEVRELVIEIDQGQPSFQLGQNVGVFIEGPHEFGQKYHHRLYSVADLPTPEHAGKPEITLVVKRCNYIDDYSGEEHRGVSSNYLCDLRPGDRLSITGPFGIPFKVPENHAANLILIGLGTGIAPFRGLVKHIYSNVSDWTGRVWLLYGARSGLELLYMNQQRDDFAQYYDEETFTAIKALSPRPDWSDPIAWDYALEERAEEIWDLLLKPDTYVYVAGVSQIRTSLDELFSDMRGSAEIWQKKKDELVQAGRWVELVY